VHRVATGRALRASALASWLIWIRARFASLATRCAVGGTETDPAERARLSAQVSTLAAPYRGVPLIKGLPVWTAAHTAEGLVLDGKVRNEAQRQALLGAAQANAASDVVDRMTLAPDMPDNWVALAEASLPGVRAVPDG
jgi:hypothetical protein